MATLIFQGIIFFSLIKDCTGVPKIRLQRESLKPEIRHYAKGKYKNVWFAFAGSAKNVPVPKECAAANCSEFQNPTSG